MKKGTPNTAGRADLASCLLLLLALAACGNEAGVATAAAPAADTAHALAELEIPQTWGLATSLGGGPFELIRYREHGDDVREAALHTYRLTFTRPYEQYPPSERETQAADQLEEELCALLEPGNQALLWLVRTSEDRRCWVFYAASTDETVARLERAREWVTTRGATMSLERDPEWTTYGELTPR